MNSPRLFRMVLFLFLVTLAAAAGAPVTPDWTTYQETIDLQPDGSARVEVRIKPASPDARELMIPCTLGEAMTGVVQKPGPVSIEPRKLGGASVFVVSRGETDPPLTELILSYTASGAFDPETAKKTDYGNTIGKYRFAQLNPLTISSFSAELILPKGLQLKAVDEFSPKAGKDDPNEPYQFLVASDGRKIVSIHLSQVKFGQAVSMKWRQFRKDGQYGLLGGMLVLALLYLVFFRDLVMGIPPVREKPLRDTM